MIDTDGREAFEASFFTTLMGEPFTPVDLNPDVIVAFDGDSWTHDFLPELPLGPLAVEFNNSSDVQAFVPILWLLDDATLEDLAEWESTEQPPFTGLAGVVYAEPGDSQLVRMDITHDGTNVVSASTVEPFTPEILTTFEAG